METIKQCFLNGKILPLEQAHISPLDRGFLFGDGVYEVIPVYRRQCFYWHKHLARLAASLKKIHLSFDTNELNELITPIKQLIAQLPQTEQAVYLQITRGVMPQRLLPIPATCTPTVFIISQAWAPVETLKITQGIRCASAEDIRWGRCDIKSISLLGAALLTPNADGAIEETLIFRNGFLSEGCRSNFIVVKEGALHVPLADSRMLGGITYQVVCDVARACGRKIIEGDISTADVFAADEIWLTSSTREMLPVVALDKQPIADGVPGKVFQQVYAKWQQHINSDVWLDV